MPKFPSRGLVHPENREEASALMVGAAILLFHNHLGPEVSSLHTEATGSRTRPCSPLSASGTPHQLTEAVTTRGCQCGPPDCEATGSDMWPGAGPSVLRIQRGQQPGRALSVIAWPPVCEGRQIPFHEVWHGKQTVQPRIQKHLSGRRKRGEKCRPQAWI